MAGRVAFLVGFALLAFLHHTGAQTMHIVGDGAGWAPQGASFYTNWTAGKTFVVGDSLRFNFATGAHDVARVQKTSFDRCDDDNEIGDTLETGPAIVALTTPGDYFFICTIANHCLLGQKLSITVAATRTATPPSSNSPSPTGSPPSSTGGPQLTPPPPLRSSSHAVVAALSATLFGVVLSLFF